MDAPPANALAPPSTAGPHAAPSTTTTHEALLRGALRKSALDVYFQPIRRSCDLGILGFEALMRGRHAPLVSPRSLLTVAEASGCAAALSLLARTRAAEAFRRQALPAPLLFVNLHRAEISRATLEPDAFVATLGELDPSRVVIEVDEMTSQEALDELSASIEDLRNVGLRFAFDDFGAGQVDLLSLMKLRPEFLKLDRSLIHGIHLHAYLRRMVLSLVKFAEGSHTRLIAEGIECAEEYRVLMDLGVPFVQGFALGHPSEQMVR